MDLDTLAKLGEFVGGFFVVISLIYLAHQVRQNTRSLKTENYARVLDRMSTLQANLAADADLSRILTMGAERPGSLTPAERLRFSWALYELFGAGEFMYHQSRLRALPDEVWARWEATIRWWLSHPGMQAWWVARPAPLSSDFDAFAEEIMRDHPVSPEAVDRWQRFVAGENLPGAPPTPAPTFGPATAAVPRDGAHPDPGTPGQ
jgi:hypothetical protein